MAAELHKQTAQAAMHTKLATTSDIEQIMSLHTGLVVEHQLIGEDPARLLRTFKYYAHTVYGLFAYACNLLLTLRDEDMIDLHRVCDAEHSAALDRLIHDRIVTTGPQSRLHVKRGLVLGTAASERLFSDIAMEIA
ncbi:MAG: hypothetical protein P8011_10665 [Acidihalobacter sp.]|uniref:hypothetical protein n=1 Tax=Acidihalobacter sp. TaxID=1872108 RepID=UPI00307CF798